MTTLTDLLPELLPVIAAICDPASAAAFKYTSKRTHEVIPLVASAHDVMSTAAYSGNLPMIKWLYSMGCTPKNIFRGKDVVVMNETNWIHSHDSTTKIVRSICSQAARGGHLGALKLLCGMGFKITPITINYAAIHNQGNVQLVKYCCNVSVDGYIELDVCLIAAATGNQNLLDWINIEYGITCWMERVACVAAAAGRIPVLKQLNRISGISIIIYSDLLRYAAYNGQIDTVQWLITQGIPPEYALEGASAGDQLHVLEWMARHYPGVSIGTTGWVADPQYDAKSPIYVLNKYK